MPLTVIKVSLTSREPGMVVSTWGATCLDNPIEVFKINFLRLSLSDLSMLTFSS